MRGEIEESSSGGSPFAQEILDKVVPLNFRLPALETYDNDSDPTEHVVAFRAQMALYGTFNALMCQAFLTTFRGLAGAWFSRLQLGTISSFDQLIREFEQNFLASVQPRPSMAMLLVLSQGEGELLSQFITCFAIEIQGFLDAHPSLIMQAFLMGLRPSRFFWSLIEKPPSAIPEMLLHVN